MQQLVAYTVIGLTTGAIYALASSGLVVTYVTSGVFNIAHGAIGMIAAFCYWQVRFEWGWPAPAALIAILGVLCPVLGLAIDRVALRGLAQATEVTRLTATVALMAAFIGVAAWVWPPENRQPFRGFFEGNNVSVVGVNVGWNKIIALIAAVAVALGLRVLLYGTRLGIQMRAVVDNRNLAELNGARPARIASASWALGASLAGLAGVLLAAEVQLNIVPLTLLVINAYAAAIFGRLKSLPLTFLGAMALGLSEAYLLWGQGQSWFPETIGGFSTSGLRQATPTIFLFILLMLLPQAKLRAGAARVRERSVIPQWNTAILGVVVLIIGSVAVTGMLTRSNTIYMIQALIMALAVVSLVPLTGYAGLVSLAPLTFAGIGAVLMSKMPGDGNVLSLIAVVLIVASIGALVALPALRLEGIYLALATGAFALLVSILVFNQGKIFANGVAEVPPLRIPGVHLSQPRPKAIFLSITFAVVGLGLVALRRSALGRRFVAMKDSPLAGATLGMNLVRTKAMAFAISAAIASLAGALDAGKVAPDNYAFDRSLPILLLAIVGGIGSIGGAFFGGMLLGLNTVLASIVPSISNITRVTPGLIGLSMGRNPNGTSHQIATAFRPVTRHPLSLVIALSGAGTLWLLVVLDVVSHWGFFAALVVWGLGIVPNLPMLTIISGRPRTLCLSIAAVGMGVASFFDDVFDAAPTGGRLLAVIILFVVVGNAIRRVHTPAEPTSTSSPDLVGLTAFTAQELSKSDRAIKVVL
ncbi:MAG: ABC transporter permease [Ilumatobacteraceae bacterium]|nr:ABC transporter permease [Ilumatobacteraceae bacterium]